MSAARAAAIKDPISRYAAEQGSAHAAICRKLRKSIDTALKGATSKIWHAIPVWFIRENPVVGYHAREEGVVLLFWNGQEFDEPDLKAVGKFHAAQIQYADAKEIDTKALRSWLRKAATNIWDYHAMRSGKRRKALMLTLEQLNQRGVGTLPGYIGIVFTGIAPGEIRAELKIRRELMAPNTYLHAGTVVTLADTSAGYGCIANLPANASGFTTIELKSNFLGTAREGTIECKATAVHLGKTTQVWDAVVSHRETGKTIALFRCTQMVLYPSA